MLNIWTLSDFTWIFIGYLSEYGFLCGADPLEKSKSTKLNYPIASTCITETSIAQY